ncbi:histidine phosphatase family protein [Nigerium massiliense]|uniref:histidine phosphatase family protein n=1 Tax=Nigerium massiliense TaxID=1522317 RepID=UPI00058AF464|nr:histidine phosphatase family protein [Nigerium massiliense]
MSPTRLVLVRHGQTEWNLTGRFQGQADIELNETGRGQARAMAPFVAALEPAALYSSDLKRALVTAETIADATGLDVRPDAQLQEINVGTWAGRYSKDVRAELPWFEEKLRTGQDFRRSDTGETGAELGDRVGAALADIAGRHPEQTVVIVGHGMALRYGLARLLGWDEQVLLGLTGLWNCSWTVLELRDRWKLLSYNNVPTDFSGVLPSLNAP